MRQSATVMARANATPMAFAGHLMECGRLSEEIELYLCWRMKWTRASNPNGEEATNLI
jgi:hypothetical protein